MVEHLSHALDIRDGQLDGQEEVPLEAQEEAGLEEGCGVVPQEGCAQHPPVLLPVVPAARPHQEDTELNYVPKPTSQIRLNMIMLLPCTWVPRRRRWECPK